MRINDTTSSGWYRSLHRLSFLSARLCHARRRGPTHWRADRHSHRKKGAPGTDYLCTRKRAPSGEGLGRAISDSRDCIRVQRLLPSINLRVCDSDRGGHTLARPMGRARKRCAPEVSVAGAVVASKIVSPIHILKSQQSETNIFEYSVCGELSSYLGQQVVISASAQA